MKNLFKWPLILLALSLLLLPACTLSNTPTPTPPAYTMGPRQIMKDGGFTFQPIASFQMQMSEHIVMMGPPGDTTTIFAFYGLPGSIPGQELTNIQSILTSLEQKSRSTQFIVSAPYSITINGFPATAVDLTGNITEAALKGQALLITPNSNQSLFAMGLARIKDDPNRWEREGLPAFNTLLHTVEFLDVLALALPCTVSTDPTYGYTKENPICVGGDVLDGPAREEAYLKTLLDPQGQPIQYTRLGSFPYKASILDTYQITLTNQTEPVTLYINEYTFAPLQAPQGFTCTTGFPLNTP